jgi:hypothetical protein
MKNLIDSIYAKEKEFGGRTSSAKKAKDDYDAEISFYNGKGFHVNSLSGPLHPGKIHTFRYDPKTKDRLSYYDKNPVVISIGTIDGPNGKLELAINLNFIPPKTKYFLMNLIWKTYYTQIKSSIGKGNIKPKKEAFVYYNYKLLKKILNKYGFGFALRTYYPSRMANCYVTCFDYWSVMALLDIKNMEGLSEGNLNKLFNEYINKQ